jgi:hypothetical protein
VSVEGKDKAIREVENGKKENEAVVCQGFGLFNSMILTIWKNRTNIIRAFE